LKKIVFGFITLLFVIFISGNMSVRTFAYEIDIDDRDGDGIVTYSEYSGEKSSGVESSYGEGGLIYEMLFEMSGQSKYTVNVGLGHGEHYTGVASRVRRFYLNSRRDKTVYPRTSSQWYASQVYEDSTSSTGWSAVVSYDGVKHNITTPATIYADGHMCDVKGLYLRNAFVKELTITDNIITIERCNAPMLKEITGGYGVEVIKKCAFEDCIYLTNLPYFPRLKEIGEFAFIGCVNLKEVLLPPSIESIWFNSFGWYEVVKTTYSGNLTNSEEEWQEFNNQVKQYKNLEKIKGITLYATKKTTTWNTLKDLYDSASVKAFEHVEYKDSSKYPGIQSDIEISDEEEQEISNWIPPVSIDIGTIEWEESPKIDPHDSKQLKSALTKEQQEVIDYIAMRYLYGDIDEGMSAALVEAMAGQIPVPMEFQAKHCKDAGCVQLVALNLKSLKRACDIQAQLNANRNLTGDAKKAQMEMESSLSNYYYYFYNTLSTTVTALEEIEANAGIFSNLSKVGPYLDRLNSMLIAYEAGDESVVKVVTRFVSECTYLAAVDIYGEILLGKVAFGQLGIYESAVFVLFGNSKAGDAASMVTTGRHFVEYISDYTWGAMFSAYEKAIRAKKGEGMKVFFDTWSYEVCETKRKLADTVNAPYGQTLTNLGYIDRMLHDPVMLYQTFTGYIDLLKNNPKEIIDTFTGSAYDVCVEGNALGQFSYEMLYDFTCKYYSGDLWEDVYKADQNITGSKY